MLNIFKRSLSALSVVLLGSVLITASGSPALAETDIDVESAQESETQLVEIKGFASGVTRLAGADRYSTAIEVSKKFSPGTPVAFVSTGLNFPDALGAAAAAANLGGPLLLTPTAEMPANVFNELKRLKPQNIVIVGGTGAVSNKVQKQLESLAPVKRLGGSDRYTTGVKIVEHAFDSATDVFIATGRNFPDALAASGAAGSVGAPMILVDGNNASVSKDVLDMLKKLDAENVYIAGGEGVVSKGVFNQLQKSGFNVVRLGGADRYSTAAVINQAFFAPGSSETVFLATGNNFPDALAGAALAGQVGAPLFVTTPSCVPEPVSNALSNLGYGSMVALGGKGVISDAAANNQICAKAQTPVTQPKPAEKKTFVENHVSPGAYCAKALSGHYGYSSTGLTMQCKTSSTDTRLRWREV